jgi:AraC-like DNA-binding protein
MVYFSIPLGLVSALIGLSVFLIVQCLSRVKQRHVHFLALLYVFNLTSQLDDLYELSGFWLNIPDLTNIYIPLAFGIAPSFFLYVKQLVAPLNTVKPNSPAQKPIHWSWHYISILIAFILCSPYYFLDSDLKLERLLSPMGTLEHLGVYTFGPYIALLALLPFSLCYILLVMRMLNSHLSNVKAYFSNIENKDLSWLRWSVVLFFIVFILFTIQLFIPSAITDSVFTRSLFLIFEFVWLSIFATLAIKQKAIYKNNEQILSIKESQLQEQTKYSRSNINESDMARIALKLKKAMEEDKLQLNPSLTLRKLSDMTGIAENNISQVLNMKIGMGYYDFINYWRIQSACEKLKQSNNSLLDITYAVGFNSRSTFNLAFKKHTGKTPSEYRKTVNVENI